MAVDTISESIQRFTADPAAARSAPAVTATLVDGRARLSAGSFNWDADLAAPLGGGNVAPSPTAYLLGALAGCAVTFLNDTLAPQFGVRIESITAVARCASDLRGLFGMDGVSPALGDIALEIDVVSPDPASKTEPMLAAWRERCPIYLALLQPNEVKLSSKVRPA
jgi:uncharacterized OsmC-like protein